MTNLDSILKSRDITLSKKVCLVKGMVFPISLVCMDVRVGLKKVERRRIDAFKVWYWDKTLEIPLDNKEIKLVNPKGNQP